MRRSLFREVFQLKETSCTLLSDNKDAMHAATLSIRHHRNELEKYARVHPEFLHSLEPVVAENGPRIVTIMAEASERADVGPMAAVAGVLADLAVEDMTLAGSKIAVVENGGEVSASSTQAIDVALSAGHSPLSRLIGFRLEEFPMGVATSSGLFSHALSFGKAEAVTVFAENAGTADAAATAIGNLIKGDDWRRAVQQGMDEALRIDGVEGVLILYRGIVGKAGKIPQLVKISDDTSGVRLSGNKDVIPSMMCSQ